MPEVIEVRKYADFIRKNIKDAKITEINILGGRYKKHGAFDGLAKLKKNLPIKIKDIKSKGKLLYFMLESNFILLSTLGLFGGWTFEPIKPIKPKKLNKKKKYKISHIPTEPPLTRSEFMERMTSHLNIEFKTDMGSLYYFDMTSFGTLKVINGVTDLNNKLKTLGPDIMDDKTTYDMFKKSITKKNQLDKEIGNVIVNQKIISGVGNYLRADALWLSKLSPFRKVKKVTDNELKLLYKSLKELTWGSYNLNKAKKLGLITKDTILPADYDKEFFIYSCEKDIYDNVIEKVELYEGSQKRFIYWVPKYQK